MHPFLAGVIGIVLLNGYAALLVLLRAGVFRVRLYRPMLWNIALSVLPVVVAGGGILVLLLIGGFSNAYLVGHESVTGVVFAILWLVILVTAAVWLLAFPNSAYLITELNMSHRRPEDPVPLWFDIVSVLTLTLSGIANAVLSLAMIQLFVLLLADAEGLPGWSWALAIGVLALGSFGVYLGRYLRFNSWDVRHPGAFAKRFFAYFIRPRRLLDSVAFVVAHTVLLALVYVPLLLIAYGNIADASVR